MCYKLSALEARPHLPGRVSQAPPASTSSTLWTTARAVLERQPPSTLPTSPRVYVPPVIGPPTPLQTLSREPHDPQDAATIPLSDQLCSLNSPQCHQFDMLHMALLNLHPLPPTPKIPISPQVVFKINLEAGPASQAFADLPANCSPKFPGSPYQIACIGDTAVSRLAQARGSLGTPVGL